MRAPIRGRRNAKSLGFRLFFLVLLLCTVSHVNAGASANTLSECVGIKSNNLQKVKDKIRCLKAITTENETNFAAWVELAEAHRMATQFHAVHIAGDESTIDKKAISKHQRKARAAVGTAIQTAVSDAERAKAHKTKGLILFEMDERDQARDAFQIALQFDPEDFVVQSRLNALKRSMGKQEL
eukprot:GFYU01015653.1.p1 GENE.GFYU01015653.1~~GFYU01015653.1.p1  ORF type:complete len:183 (+),score=21.80 GFYU01015653.1:44-592(+)